MNERICITDPMELLRRKIAYYEGEIATFQEMIDEIDGGDPNWERLPDFSHKILLRYDLEVHLRRSLMALDLLVDSGEIDQDTGRYRMLHLAEAIAILKRFAGYRPDKAVQDYWGGDVIAAYRNHCHTDTVCVAIQIKTGEDVNGRSWSEIAVNDQLIYILARVRRHLDDANTGMWVQEWLGAVPGVIAGMIPEGKTKEGAGRLLQWAMEAVVEEMRYYTVEDMKKALVEL